MKSLMKKVVTTLATMGMCAGIAMTGVSASGETRDLQPDYGGSSVTLSGSSAVSFSKANGQRVSYTLTGISSTSYIISTVYVTNGKVVSDSVYGPQCSAMGTRKRCTFNDPGSRRIYTFTANTDQTTTGYVLESYSQR